MYLKDRRDSCWWLLSRLGTQGHKEDIFLGKVAGLMSKQCNFGYQNIEHIVYHRVRKLMSLIYSSYLGKS